MHGKEPAIDFDAIERVVHHLPGFVYVLRKEADGRVAFTYLSRAIERLLGVPARDGVADASRVFERVHPEDMALVEASIENAERASAWRAEFRMRDGDGRMRWVEAADTIHYPDEATTVWTGYVQDVTERRELQEALRLSEQRLRFLALHDPLTGLPNRALFDQLLQQSLLLAARERRGLALLFIDLDGFKPVNDRHGHGAGDRLLQAVAGRLREALRASDVVARLGGDEFLVLLPTVEREDDALFVAAKIQAALVAPFAVDQAGVRISASIGASLYPAHGDSAQGLMQAADQAMYAAKAAGGGGARLAT